VTFIFGSALMLLMWKLKREKVESQKRQRKQQIGKMAIGGPFELVDSQTGKTVKNSDFLGDWILIYFGTEIILTRGQRCVIVFKSITITQSITKSIANHNHNRLNFFLVKQIMKNNFRLLKIPFMKYTIMKNNFKKMIIRQIRFQ
jgi:hypothetical protein